MLPPETRYKVVAKRVAEISRRNMMTGLSAAASVAVVAGSVAPSFGSGLGAGLRDLRGRALTLPAQPARLTIDDGRYLIALSLLHPDPVSLLAAWSGDAHRIGPDRFREYVNRSPGLEQLPTVPPSNKPFEAEPVLAVRPDVALVSLGQGPTDNQVAQLEDAGVQVAFIDFFTHPFDNQAPSLALMGVLIGREARAAAYNAFCRERLDRIAKRVAAMTDEQRPTVFLEPHAGLTADCCSSPGQGNIGNYINFVGGRNIGADRINGSFGRLSLEYVMSRDPDVYIVTGGPHMARSGGFVVGSAFSAAQLQEGLRHVVSRPGIETLSAVRGGRVHGLSHQLLNSPIDIVAVEVLARWVQPDIFADLDPAATLAEINNRFLSVPYEGRYWADLQLP